MNMPLADEIRAIFRRGRDEEKKKKEEEDEYSTEDETATIPRARSSRRKIQEERGPRHKGEMNVL